MLWNENIAVLLLHCMLHVGFRDMHESMTSQKIKKLGAGGPSLVGGGAKRLVGGPCPPPLATGLSAVEIHAHLSLYFSSINSKQKRCHVQYKNHSNRSIGFKKYWQQIEVNHWNKHLTKKTYINKQTVLRVQTSVNSKVSAKSDPGFQSGCLPDLSQNVVDSLPRRHQSFWQAS